ncbi:hypothetical protein STSP2_00709 [Anaerohalosphaera lusitana]|uniref:PSP1 C-terminal domain-containing protein n=1 Tax=Anaerohalosphaera lusitana TaxID=1936003 RepID=A0A1U9NI12_9BACT|nr:regulatory iron-sulfur-containing complex subunit RicT [Anaerohalosphaera lusitana]AQT67561.1 hypothetical protein STSP2_00709 [Anaerohalosphaera lusitana]
MSSNEKQKGQKHKKSMLVRFGKMGYVGWFEHGETNISNQRDQVVIKTHRGLELGSIINPHCHKHGQFRCSKEEVNQYYEGASKDYPMTRGGTFVRYATQEDIMEARHLDSSAQKELKTCQEFAKEMGLPMKLVDAEHLLGGERIVLYFTSDTRIDFRELVKRLAREYQTRIELRQIGARDEARLISDYETCGQECCCRRFLKILAPVNMRMAKLQKATLDPSKISGHCGRLKCCLRYEHDTYKDLKKRLPKRGTIVKTEAGEGRVVDTSILTQLVVVQYPNSNREAVPVDEIEIVGKPGSRDKGQAKDGKQDEGRDQKQAGDKGKETEARDTRSEKQQQKPKSKRRRRRKRKDNRNTDRNESSQSNSSGDRPDNSQAKDSV